MATSILFSFRHPLCLGRVLAGCCFLVAALLVWTEQGDYSIGKEYRNAVSCKIDQLELMLPQAPDIILAGAAKSGTTTLANWLLDHPRVLPNKKLECHFLNTGIHAHEVDQLLHTVYDEDSNHNNSKTKNEDLICELRLRYLHHWPELSSTSTDLFPSHGQFGRKRFFTFDKTPDYLFVSRIPQLVKTLFFGSDRPKIIVLLRNPIDRAYSHYRMDQRIFQEEHIPFEEFIRREISLLRQMGLSDFYWETDEPTTTTTTTTTSNTRKSLTVANSFSPQQMDELMDQVSDRLEGHNYLSRGLYAMQLQRWFRHGLGPNMLLLPYQELALNPQQVYRHVLEFVGMPHHALSEDMLLQKYNYNEVINEPMTNSTRRRLAAFFEESRLELRSLLEEHDKHRDYDWDALWD